MVRPLVEDYTRARRGQVKRHAVPDHDKVARINHAKGFGFIETSAGLNVYFHANSVIGSGFTALKAGDKVRLTIEDTQGEKGPQASTVTPIGKHHVVGEPGERGS